MKLKFLQAKYGIEFKIPKDFTSVLHRIFDKGKNKNLAVFSAVQFRENLDEVRELEGRYLGCEFIKIWQKFIKFHFYTYVGSESLFKKLAFVVLLGPPSIICDGGHK